MVNKIMLAVQFLTIIPTPATMVRKEEYHQIMGCFPLVGFLVGLISATVYWVSSTILPSEIALILVLMAQFMLTGGLHYDGLADTFDGCMSGRNLSRKLDIMKDSRLGTHGAVILLFIIMLKLSTLMLLPANIRIGVIILTPVIGRFALVLGAWRSVYARKEGLGHLFIGVITINEMMTAFLLLLICFLVYPAAYISVPIVLAGVILFKKVIEKSLQGMTGDTLGATNEITESLFMVVMLMLINWR